MKMIFCLLMLGQVFTERAEPVFREHQPTATNPQKGGDPVSDSSPVVASHTPTNAPTDDGAAGEVFRSIRLQQWGATWCPSCPGGKAEAQAAADQLGITLEYFDYDRNKALAAQLRVTSVPRTFVVIDDMIAHRFVGQTSSATIVAKARELAGVGKPPESRIEPVRERATPVRMQWNFEGDWNPSTSEMIDHLAEHGVDATGMTRQEMAATHDRLHNGMSARAACPTCPTTSYRRRSGGKFFGLFR